MPPIVIDLVIAALILGLTYALMSEGLWGSALMFFNILFAGIIAFNFYEPLAKLLAANLSFMSHHVDMLCLMSVFLVTLVILRLTTETIAPAMVRFPTAVYQVGRIFFGLAGSVVLMAILLLAFDTAAVHKKVFTVVDYKYQPPFHMGIDHAWLGFFQYTTGAIFPNNSPANSDWMREYGNAKVFDPKAEWLLIHQDARPYGQETVLGGAPVEGGAGGGGGGAPGADAGGRPGDIKVMGATSGVPVVVPQ
jgi:uncharacterized membrane protein required for colicin V production